MHVFKIPVAMRKFRQSYYNNLAYKPACAPLADGRSARVLSRCDSASWSPKSYMQQFLHVGYTCDDGDE